MADRVNPRKASTAKFVTILAMTMLLVHVVSSAAHLGRKLPIAWTQYYAAREVVATNFKYGCASERCESCLHNIWSNPDQISFVGNSSQFVALELAALQEQTTRPVQSCFRGSSYIDQWADILNSAVPNQPQQILFYGYVPWEFLWLGDPINVERSPRFTATLESLFLGIQSNYRLRLLRLGLPRSFVTGFRPEDQIIPTLTDVLKRQTYYQFRRVGAIRTRTYDEITAVIRNFIESMGHIERLYLYQAPDLKEISYFNISESQLQNLNKIIRDVAEEYSNTTYIDINTSSCGILSEDYWNQTTLELDPNHINENGRVKFTRCFIEQAKSYGIFQ